jgi:hypothetical protein
MILLWMNPNHLADSVEEAFIVENHGIWEATYGNAFDEPILSLTPREGVTVTWWGGWYGSDVEKPNYHVWQVVMPDGSARHYVTTRQEGQNDWFDLRERNQADFLAATPKKLPQVNRVGFMMVEADDSYPPKFRILRLSDLDIE